MNRMQWEAAIHRLRQMEERLPDVIDSYGRLRKEKLADYDMIQGLIARGVKVRMTKEEL